VKALTSSLAVSLSLSLSLTACNGSSNNADAGAVDMTVKPSRDMTPAPSGCVGGTLQDESGAPVAPMTNILACSSELCVTKPTNLDGSFKICGLHLRKIVVKTEEDFSVKPRRAAVMWPIELTANGEEINIPRFTVPLLGDGANLSGVMDTPQTLALGDGLSVTLLQRDFVLPLGTSTDNLAARAVPEGQHQTFIIPDGGTTLAVYALSPFTATTKPKTSLFSFQAKLATAPGAEVHFWAISELDGSLGRAPSEVPPVLAPAIGHGDGTMVSTDPGQGLGEMSWLVISSKAP